MSWMRRLAGASFIYGIGGVASRVVSLLLLPVLTRYLAPSDYGVVAMLAMMNSLLLAAVTLGTGNSMGICFHESTRAEHRNEVVWSTAAVVASNSLVWGAIGALASVPISELLFDTDAHGAAVLIALGQLVLSATIQPLLGRWRLEERPRAFIMATLGLALATAVANVYVVVRLQLGLLGLLTSTLAVQCVHAIVLYAFCAVRFPPRLSRTIMLRLIRLGWPSIFGVGAFFLLDFVGRWLVGRHVGLDSLGVYSIGVALGLGMAIFTEGAFGSAWPAFFLSFHDRREEASNVFGKVLQHYLVWFLTLAAAFFLLARPVVQLLTAEPFHAAAHIVGIVALCSVLKGAYLIFLPGLYFHRKLHIQAALEWLGALTGLAACAIFVPQLGMLGAAIGTLVGYLALCVATALVAGKYLRIDVQRRKVSSVVAVFTAVAAVSFIDFAVPLWVDWIVRVGATLAVAAFVALTFGRTIARSFRADPSSVSARS